MYNLQTKLHLYRHTPISIPLFKYALLIFNNELPFILIHAISEINEGNLEAISPSIEISESTEFNNKLDFDKLFNFDEF